MLASLPLPGFANQPSAGAWRKLSLILLGLALLPVIGLFFDFTPDFTRRALILHASMASVLLPLCLLGQLAAGGRPAPAWSDRLLWLSLAGAAVGLSALILSGAGHPLLLSFFPLLRETVQPALLIAPLVLAVFALLLRPTAPDPARTDAGLVWLAIPLLVTLLILAWGWIASADSAPHVREELVAWGTGHAWMLALSTLSVRGWLQISEINGSAAVGWTRMMALAAAGLLLVPAGLPIDSAEYLKTLSWLTLALCGLVPAALAIDLLRDPVRRAVGGAWLFAALAVFFVPLIGAAWLLLGGDAGNRATLRGGPLLLQHGLGLAAITALWGALRRQQGRSSTSASPDGAPNIARPNTALVFQLAVVAIAGGLILTLAIDPPQLAIKKTDPGSRQHAVDRRQQEIAERFQQGVTMMQLRRYDDAVTAFHRVLVLDPTIPEAHVNIGFAMYETGQHAAAQRFFEAATRLNKNQLNAYYGIALTARAQGANEVAAGAIRTWLHLAPPDDPFRPRAEALFDAAAADSRQARSAASATP